MISVDKLEAVKRIVTHDNCADGRMSALILHDALPEAEIIFVQYGTEKYKTLKPSSGDGSEHHGTTLFCDIVPYVEADKGAITETGKAQLAAWVESGAIVLDHHKGAKEIVDAFGANGVYADEKTEPGVSGAMLAFREVWCRMYPGAVTAAAAGKGGSYSRWHRRARLAGTYDTWQKSDRDWIAAREQALAVMFWPWDELQGLSFALDDKLAIGRVLIQKHEAKVAEAVKTALRFQTNGLRVAMLQADTEVVNDASDVIGAEADLVVGFGFSVNEKGAPFVKFSCRSKQVDGASFDCAAFAKSFGGGGHTQAAGFARDFPALRDFFEGKLIAYLASVHSAP